MNIHHNISLKKFNTFGIEVYAKNFVEVNSIEELKSVLKEFPSTPKLILGGGSNVLFTKNFEGLVIKINIKGKEIVSKNRDHILVKAYAGEVWHELVLWTIDNNWGGLENLSLIPGSVGAAPMQNIGAYGVEIKDHFEYLEALNLKTFEIERFNNEQCKFGYRDSVFKNIYKDQYIILSVVFKLSTHPVFNTSYGAIEDQLKLMHVETKTLQSISDAVIAIRQSKLPNPAELGNSGSFFKNPVVTKAFLNSSFKSILQPHIMLLEMIIKYPQDG